MYLQWQTVRIKEERHLFSCIAVCPNRLTLDSHLGQLFHGFFYTFYAEGQMSQTTGFRSVHPLRWVLLCKNLKFYVFIYPKIQLPIISLSSVVLTNYFKAEFFDIKFSGFLDVRNNDCNVMY